VRHEHRCPDTGDGASIIGGSAGGRRCVGGALESRLAVAAAASATSQDGGITAVLGKRKAMDRGHNGRGASGKNKSSAVEKRDTIALHSCKARNRCVRERSRSRSTIRFVPVPWARKAKVVNRMYRNALFGHEKIHVITRFSAQRLPHNGRMLTTNLVVKLVVEVVERLYDVVNGLVPPGDCVVYYTVCSALHTSNCTQRRIALFVEHSRENV
jgi:hypothetical protein